VPLQSIEIHADRMIQVEAIVVPEEDPDAIWQA
jgi:hypothetical protein